MTNNKLLPFGFPVVPGKEHDNREPLLSRPYPLICLPLPVEFAHYGNASTAGREVAKAAPFAAAAGRRSPSAVRVDPRVSSIAERIRRFSGRSNEKRSCWKKSKCALAGPERICRATSSEPRRNTSRASTRR
jgi:hypothetical protein